MDLVAQGVYTIDGFGRIWRTGYRRGEKVLPVDPKPATRLCSRYLIVEFRWNGRMEHVSAHRLVFRHFNGGRLRRDLVVDHIDRDTTNNHPDNLQAITHATNVRLMWARGSRDKEDAA